jgi:hypothetical protein
VREVFGIIDADDSGCGGRDAMTMTPQRPAARAVARCDDCDSPAAGRTSGGPMRATAHRAGRALAAAQHSNPVIATAQHSDPVIATAQHSDPVIATAQHSDPVIATAQHLETMIVPAHRLRQRRSFGGAALLPRPMACVPRRLSARRAAGTSTARSWTRRRGSSAAASASVRPRPRRLRALRILRSESDVRGAFVWARRGGGRLAAKKRWLPGSDVRGGPRQGLRDDGPGRRRRGVPAQRSGPVIATAQRSNPVIATAQYSHPVLATAQHLETMIVPAQRRRRAGDVRGVRGLVAGAPAQHAGGRGCDSSACAMVRRGGRASRPSSSSATWRTPTSRRPSARSGQRPLSVSLARAPSLSLSLARPLSLARALSLCSSRTAVSETEAPDQISLRKSDVYSYNAEERQPTATIRHGRAPGRDQRQGGGLGGVDAGGAEGAPRGAGHGRAQGLRAAGRGRVRLPGPGAHELGLGRIAAVHHRSSTSHHIR